MADAYPDARIGIQSGGMFGVPGALAIADDQTECWLLVGQSLIVVAARAVVKTAPLVSAITMQIEKSSNQGGAWAEVVAPADFWIAAGTKSGIKTGLAVALAAGDVLRLNLDQVGTGTTGADLTVLLDVKIGL